MRMLKLAISTKVVNHGDFPILLILGRLLRPHFGSLWTHLPVLLHPRLHSFTTWKTLTKSSFQPHNTHKKHRFEQQLNYFLFFLQRCTRVKVLAISKWIRAQILKKLHHFLNQRERDQGLNRICRTKRRKWNSDKNHELYIYTYIRLYKMVRKYEN